MAFDLGKIGLKKLRQMTDRTPKMWRHFEYAIFVEFSLLLREGLMKV